MRVEGRGSNMGWSTVRGEGRGCVPHGVRGSEGEREGGREREEKGEGRARREEGGGRGSTWVKIISPAVIAHRCLFMSNYARSPDPGRHHLAANTRPLTYLPRARNHIAL